MEYIYAALVLHEADREIDEASLTAILEAAGVDVDPSRAKAVVAALEEVDVEEALQGAAMAPAAPAPAETEAPAEEAEAEAEEPEEEEEGEEEEEAAAEGLGDLFG